MKKVLVLGSTGSIGAKAIKGVAEKQDELFLCGATFHNSKPENLNCPLFHLNGNYSGLENFIERTKPDVVLNGISGIEGLKASLSVLKTETELALANKETVVLGGKQFLDAAKKHGVKIIPVDSEHSALEELIITNGKENISKLIITASGGPFLREKPENLEKIKPEAAIKHPTWKMGPKISIDSSTLANKGLEIIEAHFLFGFSAEDIQVVIHPQSVIHSMVQTKSGEIYAQMSDPDMIFPIMRSLLGRTSKTMISTPLDFTNLNLSFEKPDYDKFPFLKDAYECIQKEGWAPIVFNTADEAAVKAFMEGKIKFTQIHDIVRQALDSDWGPFNLSLEDIPKAVDSIYSEVCEKWL